MTRDPLDVWMHCCHRSAKLHIFPYPTSLSQQKSESQDTTIQVSFGTEVAKTLIYSVMCRFPLFVTLRDHNPPTLQRDDRRHACGISMTCYTKNSSKLHQGFTLCLSGHSFWSYTRMGQFFQNRISGKNWSRLLLQARCPINRVKTVTCIAGHSGSSTQN